MSDHLPDIATSASQDALADPPAIDARALRRGVSRLLGQMGFCAIAEFSLGNGRRADLAALDRAGHLLLVEIKVSMADLRGDRKWPDYLDFADQFFFAVPAGFATDVFEGPDFAPERCGLIIGDGFGASVIRPAAETKLAAARRKALTLRFARAAAQRLTTVMDPDAGRSDGSGYGSVGAGANQLL